MMTEKQIYRRMNEAYELHFENHDEDEWYGDDDPHVWRFYRPSRKQEYQLIMDEPKKIVNVYVKKPTGELSKFGVYDWKR